MAGGRKNTIVDIGLKGLPIDIERYWAREAIARVGIVLKIVDLQWKDTQAMHLGSKELGSKGIAMIAAAATIHLGRRKGADDAADIGSILRMNSS